MDVDPDYVSFDIDKSHQETSYNLPQLENNARTEVVERIKNIISEQFDKEIQIRENELALINERLTKARHIMDRLRACIVASYYARSFTKSGAKGPGAGASQHPAIQNVLRRAVTTVLSKNPPPPPLKQTADIDNRQEKITDASVLSNTDSVETEMQEDKPDVDDENSEVDPGASTHHEETSPKQALGGRLRLKKTIIVGNVSKYIPSDQREASDRSTHKWMVYVRGDKENPRIDNFVRKVWFFLHPSYRPHDIVEVAESPFHLTRRGWGEFPIRVQIHFCDRRARPVDIIHGLKLDRTYTGLQTLGAETVCEVELDQSSIRSSPTDILESELTSIPMEDTEEDKRTKSNEGNGPESVVTGSADKEKECNVCANGDEESNPSSLDNSSRKRKFDESLRTAVQPSGFSTAHMRLECTVDGEAGASVKKRRKRRIDFSSENLSNHYKSTLMSTPPVSSTNVKSEVCSDEEAPTTCESEADVNTSKVNIKSKTDENTKFTDTEKKNVNPLPSAIKTKSSAGASNAAFRMRSASVGDNTMKLSTSELVKSAITISPAISVKVSPGMSPITNASGMKNIAFSIPKSPNDSRLKTRAIVLPVSHKKFDDKGSSKHSLKDNPSKTTIPLSSIFKSGSVQPVKPLVLKVAGTSQRVSPTFSINILNLGSQGSSKIREKRSMSADFAPPPKLTCFTTLKNNKQTGMQKSTPITQLHIITPGVKSKPNIPATAISLQDLQNALSTGTITLAPKLDTSGDPNMSTKEHSKKEGKKQSPISSQSQDSPTSAAKSKGKKSANVNVKLAPELKQGTASKIPTTKDVSSASVKPNPIHQIIGDGISVPAESNMVVEDLLPCIARKVPLIMEVRNFLQFPFCATSESEFLEWNVGKQRASEFKRSILIREVLKYLIGSHKSLKESKLPSKKFITDWCLTHGYSIFTDEFEEGSDESTLRDENDKNSNIESTLASSQTLMKKLEPIGKSMDEEDCMMVDVSSVDEVPPLPRKKAGSITNTEMVTDVPAKLKELMSSSEILLVEEQTRQIGIQLHHQDGLPATHMVLVKALQQFVESLLRKALSRRLTRRDGTSLQRIAPDEIFVRDVVDAVSVTDAFDFLSDNNLASDL